MKYKIILADCPWPYRNRPPKGAVPYPTLSLEELKSLPVNQIADKNCALFFWATPPLIRQALDVIEAWGFEYVTKAFTWVKTYHNGNIVLGLGYYTRGNDEPCLPAKKGRIRRLETATDISQVIFAPIRRHSAKPPEVREKIVQLMGDLPRIELFARERTPGWHSLGLDLDGMDIRKSLYMINVCNQINR